MHSACTARVHSLLINILMRTATFCWKCSRNSPWMVVLILEPPADLEQWYRCLLGSGEFFNTDSTSTKQTEIASVLCTRFDSTWTNCGISIITHVVSLAFICAYVNELPFNVNGSESTFRTFNPHDDRGYSYEPRGRLGVTRENTTWNLRSKFCHARPQPISRRNNTRAHTSLN